MNELIHALNKPGKIPYGRRLGARRNVRNEAAEERSADGGNRNGERLCLGEEIGCTGAQDYLALVTFPLMEDPGSKVVYFVFEAGERVMPAVYNRAINACFKIVS